MNGFEKQELETQGMMSRLFGSKPGHNALVEIIFWQKVLLLLN